MTRARRAALATLLALSALWIGSASVVAHALLLSSDPPANAVLASAPATVTLVFTERPDPALSSVRVLDASGKGHTTGAVRNGSGGDKTLAIPLDPLPGGVYTVIWRTVSIDDGHASTGSFAFSVGAARRPCRARLPGRPRRTRRQARPPSRELGAVAGGVLPRRPRAARAARAGRAPPGRPRPALGRARLAAWAAALGGGGAVFLAQASDAGVAPGDALGSSLGLDLALRLLPLAGAGRSSCSASARRRVGEPRTSPQPPWWRSRSSPTRRRPTPRPRRRPPSTSRCRPSRAGRRGLARRARGRGARAAPARPRGARCPDPGRFSRWATVGIVAVGLTGVARAAFELQGLDQLATTDYGRLLVAKAAVFAGLAALGAANHFRHVPAGDAGARSVQRLGAIELALGTVAVLVAALLVTTPPPATAASLSPGGSGSASPAPSPTAPPPPQVTATGADYATTIRVKLTVTPGTPGPGQFSAAVTDFDSGAPIAATGVKLRFALPSRADVSPSSLVLAPAPDGTFAGSGSNLSLTGFWTVTAVVVRDGKTVEVPLAVPVAPDAGPVQVLRIPGQPTSYTVDLGAKNSVQLYLDTSVSRDPATLHVTYFDARGKERPVTDIAVQAAGPDGRPIDLPMSDIEPGHATAKLTVTPGAPPTELFVTAIDPDDAPITVVIAIGADD
ncbi:MAG: copper resistance protein CopC [Chloroflexota bacterium]